MECSDCVPTEDAIQALIDYLVYPLLPAKDFFSPEPPALAQQESVAKQLLAVVLLYNYYHRKQCPQLEFLDFRSFCKSASIAKPSLLMYMKSICKPELPNNTEQLSVTEKMIWDACNICIGLDMLKDDKNMQSWQVSKVAVLLVDSTNLNCFLQFSSITQGVWSLIEKDVDKLLYNQPNASPINITYKKKSRTGQFGAKLLPHEEVFQQLAFTAVKEKAGISEEELTIIERHTACSLSQQKASARFYLMRYLGTSNDKVTEFSVKDLVDSLRGPLFSKDLTVKPVVEYFHLLPYADILSDWLSRQQSVGGLPSSLEQQGNLGENVQAGRTPIEEFEVSDRSFSTAGAEEILDKKASDNDGIINMKEHDLSCMIRSSGSACIPQKVDKDISLKYPHLMTLSKDETQALENATENKHVEEGGKFLVVNDSLLHGDGFKDEVDLDGLIKKPSIIEFTDSRQSSRSDVCNIVFSGQGGEIVTDLPLVPMSNNPQIPDKFQLASMSFDLQCGGKFQAVLESKKRDLLVASSRVLQRKREELHHQRRLLEDEIAQCEMNLQRVLNAKYARENFHLIETKAGHRIPKGGDYLRQF
uniref:DNA gyrase subunit B n=1 Tax=Anthurium amnicola TaxID=1678845 RepID=A0A1D1Z0E0_9ARAE